MIGNIIGSNFKIIAKLGEGGMGAVYKGVDMMTEREVAIKALRPELASQPEVAERFRSEAVTLAKLNHPNIATLYNFFRQGDEYYMVLEFVRGETLDSLLSQHGAMPVAQAVPLFCKVLEGIDHAHEEGIIHRDIKPANMMLTTKGNLKVLDFGIARILGTARMTKAGHLIGTIEYMAPEQVKGLETDARSDIYSLGMLLYELLTGRVPFDIQNEFELMSAQINQMPVPPRQLNPNIPVEVEEAIMHAVAKDPDARYQTAGDFREVLMSAGIPMSGAHVGSSATTANRNNPYATRASNTTPPTSPPAMPVPSGNRPLPETIIDPNSAPPPLSAGAKETRLGVAGAALSAPAATAAGAKETRLGAPPVGMTPPAPQTLGAQQMPRAQAASGSFFSKLKPIHYIVAGVAALIVIFVVISVPLLFLLGSKSGGAAKPLATQQPAVETPVAPPAAEPATPQQAGTQAPNSVGNGGGDPASLPGAESPAPVKTDAPLPVEGLTIDSPKSASSPRAVKPNAPPSRPRNNDAAAEARRKREAALRALDQ